MKKNILKIVMLSLLITVFATACGGSKKDDERPDADGSADSGDTQADSG